MNLTEYKGNKYSRKSFEGYKFSCKIIITTEEDEQVSLDIYTTDNNMFSIIDFIKTRLRKPVKAVEAKNLTSKEQDDKTAEFIDMVLNKEPKINGNINESYIDENGNTVITDFDLKSVSV